MRLAKKVRGTVKESESFRGKLVKTMGEEASCCSTSCIYRGEEDQSFFIGSSLESKMACAKWDRVLVTEFVDGEQFITEEIIEEGNRWPSIEVRTIWHRKIIRVASLNGGTLPYTKIKEVRMKAYQCEESCFKAIEGNVKEYQIRSMELAVVVLN
ncbi:hypothetical protein Tco_0281371 [Tanacetum coccineum]